MGKQVAVRHPDGSYPMERAPEWITRACRLRFEMEQALCVADPEKPDTFRWNPDNFWDGYTEVRVSPGDGTRGDLFEFTDAYSGDTEVFDTEGQTVSRTPRPAPAPRPLVQPTVLEYVSDRSYMSPEPGALGLYFQDGSDYVPGLDCGRYTVWLVAVVSQGEPRALSYYDRPGMLRSWREVPADRTTPEAIERVRPVRY